MSFGSSVHLAYAARAMRWACTLLASAILLGGCVAGREGILDRDGSVVGPRDGSMGRRDGSTDGSMGGDGSTLDDGGTGFDAAALPDGSLPRFEALCDDGFDADADGLTDCEDPDCDGVICNAAGATCSDTTCGGCRGEPSETMCGDGADEDCDGFTDCQDADCDAAECGPGGAVCASMSCPCASGFNERMCGDGTDDDCDSLVDCADPDCEGRACAGGGMICTSGACTCSPSLEFCNDRDEDCDGVVDDGCPRALSLCCPSSAGSFGGTGGVTFADPCPTGTMLMGIAGRASTRIDQVQPICAALVMETDRSARPDFGYPIRRSAAILGAPHGGAGGTAFDDRCPGNDVVIGVRVTTDMLGETLSSLSLQCGTVTASRVGLSFGLSITPSMETPVRGGAGDTPYRSDCVSGAVTVVDGRASTIVDRLGFGCQRLELQTL